MVLYSLTFYLFSSVAVLSALMVISAKNPVHSVLFLILSFVNASGLFVLLGAEFLAMILVVVYVGAVAVLFLFVVMMLDIQKVTLMLNIKKYVPIAVVFASIILAEIIYLTVYKTTKVNPDIIIKHENNTEQIGDVLYTTYFIDFQLSGIVLLLAMIGAIVLTHVYRPSIKRQNIDKQNTTSSTNRVQLLKIKSGQGIKND